MLWDGETGARIGSPHTLFEAVTALAIAPLNPGLTGYLTAVGFEHGALQLVQLSLSDCTPLVKLPPNWSHLGMAVCQLSFFAVGADGLKLASGGEDGLTRIFSIDTEDFNRQDYIPGP